MAMAGRSYGAAGQLVHAATQQKVSAADSFFAPYAAEFVGTFVLVFTVGSTMLAPSESVWAGTSLVSSSPAIGLVFMVMMYCTGPISGGNLNPAISFSLGLIGHLSWLVVIRYALVQLAAGVLASLFLHVLYVPKITGLGPVAPFTWEYAVTAEVIYTCVLCFVVNNCAASKRNNPKEDENQFAALAIGFAAVAGNCAVGSVSGAALNPAIALGLPIFGTGLHWVGSWWAAELLGAGLAAILFRVVRPEEYNPPDPGFDSTYAPRLPVRCASEFLGTFFLVLTTGLTLVIGLPAVAFSAASVLVSMIYSLGNISGGHFNPAVTLAVVLSGRDKCSPWDGAAYVVAQVLGGACAGILYARFHAAGPNAELTFGLMRGSEYGPNAVGVAELFFTFVLAYAVLSCATTSPPPGWRTQHNFYAALAIGSCVTAGGCAIMAISGGFLNPAVSVGMAVANIAHHGWSRPAPFSSCITLSLWELTGGLLAAVVFRLTHPDEFKKAPLLAK